MSLFSAIGSAISGVVNGVTGLVGNTISNVVGGAIHGVLGGGEVQSLVGTVANSSAGQAFAGAVGGSVGGVSGAVSSGVRGGSNTGSPAASTNPGAVASAGVVNTNQNVRSMNPVSTGAGYDAKIEGFSYYISPYQINTVTGLYVLDTQGYPQISWPTMAGYAATGGIVIWGLVAIFGKKKRSFRRSTRKKY